jgi:hypothetical protein
MNLSEARIEVKARGFDYLPDGRLTIALNNAKNHLEDAADWPWLETTATGTSPLEITDLKSVLSVVDTTNDTRLTEADIRDFPEDADTTGRPDFWYLDGLTTLRVYPLQEVALSVRYLKYSPELVNITDTPLIPARYHSVWIDLAVAETYKDDDNFAGYQAVIADADRRIEQMMQTFVFRNHQGPGMQALTYASEDW